MEFRILGPLEVLEDGRQLDLGGAKQQALLAMLLLHANEVLSQDRLIEAVWEEQPPETAPKALQVYISRLRKTLGKERLETKARGYLLRVAEGELDLERFQRLADEQPKEALGLWRGEPLAEFAYQRFAQTEIARLEELRLACLERRLEEDLEQGRHAAVVGELERLVREHPLRERLRAQLMLALYRSGRQAEALEAYQDARRALTEELGIEPSRSLRDLHQAILQQDAALELAPDADDVRDAPPEPPRPTADLPEPGTRSERKTVSVMHVQLSTESESREQLDPEVLRLVTSRAFRELIAGVESHQGTVETITSDGITAVFGLPTVHEDDAARALRAAEDAQSRLASVDPAADSQVVLEVRIGISTGAVVTADDESAVHHRATGEPFTASVRLARDCAPGEIEMDEATRRSVERSRRPESRFTSPMVGRARERRRMHDAFDQAIADRSCQLFTVLGAAGVGKSRLVQEFLADLEGRTLIARGRCLPYGEGITFWPVLEAVKDIGGLDETSTPEDAQSSLAALIDDTEDASLVAQRVSEAIGLTEASTSIEEGFEAVQAFFEALASRSPLVVVFDDVHWGEPTFLDLVEHIADWSKGVPILLLCLARPELLDTRGTWGGGKVNATSALLEPLSDDECVELVANLVGEAQLAEEVEARIAIAAEGNPLFVEEMLSMLIDDGILVREDGRWVATADITSVPVPPTIHALLAARLDQLSPDERAVIEPAAVEGKLFHETSVAHLAPHVQVPAALATLVRKELIRPERPVFAGERAFHFRHLLIRDAAYGAIPKESRAVLHERHVGWLEPKTGERSVEFDEIVGYHLEQAVRYRTELGRVDDATHGLARRAAERLGAAGRRAFARSDPPAGLKLISRAVALLPPEDPLRVELVPNVRVVQGAEDLSWADKVLTEAVEAAATTGDRRLAAHALVQRGLLRLFSDPSVTPDELLDVAERARAAFEELDDELGMARAWRLTAQAHYLDHRASACAQASEHALVFARRSADRFEQSELVEWLVIALTFGPAHARDAIVRCQHLLDESAGDPRLEAQVLSALAPLLTMQARTAEADEALAQGSRVMEEAGESIWIVSYWRSLVHLWRNDAYAAERELRPPYEALKRVGDNNHFNTMAIGLANALYMQGLFDKAEELTHECEEACRPNDIYSHILWRSTRAKVFAHRREIEDALELAHEAVALAERSDFLHSQARAMEDLATVLSMAGRSDEARTALEVAAGSFEEKGDLLGVERARRPLTGSAASAPAAS